MAAVNYSQPSNLNNNFTPLTERNDIVKLLPFVCAYAATFKDNFTRWTTPLRLDPYHPNSAGIATSDGFEARPDCFFHPTYALKVAICTNEKVAIIVLQGALGAGASEVDPNDRNAIEAVLATQAFTRDTQTNPLTSEVPKAYLLTNALVQSLISHPSLNQKKIYLCGVSSGGTYAQYIGLKQRIQTVCLNPYPMGKILQQDIGSERLKLAPYYITCVSAQMDFCSHALMVDPNLANDPRTSVLNAQGAKNFGKKHTITSAYSDPERTHSLITHSVMHSLGLDARAYPQNIPQPMITSCIQQLERYEPTSSLARFTRLTMQAENPAEQASALLLLTASAKAMLFDAMWSMPAETVNSGTSVLHKRALVCQALWTTLDQLPVDAQHTIYGRMYTLIHPKSEAVDSDPLWAEHHAKDPEHSALLADALTSRTD